MSDPVTTARSRLQHYRGRYPEIARRFELNYATLRKFASGERGSKRPSFAFITSVQTMLDELEREEGAVAEIQEGAAHGRQ